MIFKNVFIKIAFVFILFFHTIVSFAGTIYVATTGSDSAPNDGTIGKPYLTINKAAQVAVAGDVVIIKSGTYIPTASIVVVNSGTSIAPITFKAEVADGVIIDGTNSPTPNASDRQGLFTILGTTAITKNWIVVDGLRVINSKFAGIYSRYSDNNTIKNCSTYNTGASGIIDANSSNIKVLNNKVQQACMYPDSSVGTNECITMASVSTFEVAYNTVSDRMTEPSNGGEGIDAKNNSTNGSFHHNTITNLIRIGIYIDAFSGNLSNVEVYANKIYSTKGGGITIASEQGGTVNGVKLHDNLIYDIEKFGIRIAGYLNDGPLKNLDVYQNTIVNCGYNAGTWENVGFLLEAKNVTETGFNIRNNIISGCPYQVRGNNQTFSYVLDNNLLFGPTVISGTNAMTTDPLFKNAAAKDFSLTASSAAVNMAVGSPLSAKDFIDRVRPIGASTDIGAFEFNPNLGINDDNKIEKQFLIGYSNSHSRLLNLSYKSVSADKCEFLLYDLQGRLIYKSHTLLPTLGINTYAIETSNYNSGVYIVVLSIADGSSFAYKVNIE